MTSYTSAEATAIFIQIVIALVIVRRAYAMSQGVSYSVARLALAPALILFLWLVSELGSLLLIPWALPYLIVADTAILVVAAIGFARVAEAATEVTRNASGDWSYRIGFATALLYLVVFLARLAVAIALFPSVLELGAPPSGYPPFGQQVVLADIDAALSVSAGLLIGRSIGVVRKLRSVRDGPIPSTPT
jgi:hypothetical protein